eukprot:7428318-Karenia_brevis.AAC.1
MVINAEFKKEIEDVKKQLAVDSVHSHDIDPDYERALNFAILQLNSNIMLKVDDYQRAIVQWLSPKFAAEEYVVHITDKKEKTKSASVLFKGHG